MSLRRSGLILAVVAAGLTACSSGSASTGETNPPPTTPAARPSTTAKLAILSPKNGQTLSGPNVVLKVSLQDAQIVPATTTHIVPNQGHLHVYLDNQIVSMTFGLDQAIPNVTAGQHVLRVEFVASDHLPFDPRDFTQIVFTVK